MGTTQPVKQAYLIDVVCAWCQTLLGHKESDHEGTSHGICPECKAKFFPGR